MNERTVDLVALFYNGHDVRVSGAAKFGERVGVFTDEGRSWG